MGLDDCPDLWGYATVIDRDPRVEIHEDVLFVPSGIGGIFDRGRHFVAGSGYYRGLRSALGLLDLVHGSVFSPVDPETVSSSYDESVVFGGVLIDHFGHFLIGTLARFWNIAAREGRKLLVINGGDLSRFFDLPTYREILPTLGLFPSDFITFDGPVRLRQVVVPFASFEENNIAHLAYGRMCTQIAKVLAPERRQQSKPVFLAKTRLKSGITKVENEDVLCERLEKAGVEIVFPEELSFAEQIAVFQQSPAISGFMGSGFHLSAFAAGCNIMAVNHSPAIISNQVLIDRLSGNKARYVFSPETFTAYGEKGAFQRTFRLNDVEATASDLLRYYERAC